MPRVAAIHGAHYADADGGEAYGGRDGRRGTMEQPRSRRD